jgi:hypothetical protein
MGSFRHTSPRSVHQDSLYFETEDISHTRPPLLWIWRRGALRREIGYEFPSYIYFDGVGCFELEAS